MQKTREGRDGQCSQGKEFIGLQKAKIERGASAAEEAGDAGGLCPGGEHRCHGPATIEESAACMNPGEVAARQGSAAARDYEMAVADMVDAARAFVRAPPKDAPHNTYIAQSVPNPTAASGRSAIGRDYVAMPKSGILSRASPVGFDCGTDDSNACVDACQARSFDVGAVGFTLERDPNGGNALCTPLVTADYLDSIRQSVSATPQHPPLPGGSWKASVMPGSTPRMEGNVLVAQLRTSAGDAQTARTRVTDPAATYSNDNGTFRQDLNGEAGLAAITITDTPPGVKSITLKDNVLVMSTDKGKSYSTLVNAGDVVKFQSAKVSCSGDGQCEAAGLPTWINGVARPGAYHCPKPGGYCFDPSSGQYAEVGKLTTTPGPTPPVGKQIERSSYSLNYDHGPIDTSVLGRVSYVDEAGSAPVPDHDLSWRGREYQSVGRFRPTYTQGTAAPADHATLKSCENACTADPECRGFSFVSAGKNRKAECHALSGTDWPRGLRVYDENAEMMVKLPQVTGLGPGCPAHTTVGAASSVVPDRTTDLPVRGCGVPGILAEHSSAVRAAGSRFATAESEESKAAGNALKENSTLNAKMAVAARRTAAQLQSHKKSSLERRRDREQAFQAGARASTTDLQARSDGARYLLWAGIAVGIAAVGAAAMRR